MCKFLCKFSVNGKRTEQVVTARDSYSAKKLIEAQYANAKIVWYANPQRI